MADRRTVREVVATVLVVLGAVAIVVASTGWWLERNFLDTSRFTGTANHLLDEDAVQAELTNVLVRQLSKEAGTDLQIAEPFLASIVSNVVDSDAFRTVFDAALSRAHRVLVDRGTEHIILNLTDAYDQIKGPLRQVAPKLADQLPSRDQLQVVLLERSQLSTVWDTIDVVKHVIILVTIVAILLVGAGIALAADRWRALARCAWTVTAAGLVLVVALLVARVVARWQVSDGTVADAVVAALRVITNPLLVQTVVLAVVAALVAVAARFTARAGLPAWKPAAARARDWVADTLPRDGEVPALGRLRLPPPKVESRGIRAARAAGVGAVGLLAVFEPAAVSHALVFLAGLVLLVLAALEAVAAWRAPARRGRSTGERAAS
ncbi:MAG TPA: hypothetical protein VH986_05005 [Acidimicrobiia bacterium]|jgi:hypothetical protein